MLSFKMQSTFAVIKNTTKSSFHGDPDEIFRNMVGHRGGVSGGGVQ